MTSGPRLDLGPAAALQLLVDEPAGLVLPDVWAAPLLDLGLARPRGDRTQATAEGRLVARAIPVALRRVLMGEGRRLWVGWKAGRIDILTADTYAERETGVGSRSIEDRRGSHFRPRGAL